MDAKKAKIVEKRNLRMLSLSWERNHASKLEEDVDEKVLEVLEPHSNLEYVCIQGFSGRHLPCWMTSSTLGKECGVEYIIEEEEKEEKVGSAHPWLSKEQGSNKSFPNLHILWTEHWLYRFPLPNLKELTVIGCPHLERQYQRGNGEDWHKIVQVRHIFVSPI
ncbi:putative disease resistance protein RGA4 [Salvia divinorum]|uniref:Disease resistance protein RGA4 n=1 Tax=Salvia divinorum TaxID=28513 RepID=A0ABD1G960_SALDI